MRVYLPPYLKNSMLDQSGYIKIRKDSNLRELFKLLGIPFPHGLVHLCRVNYEPAKLNRILAEGDTISFYALISGG